ncbi:tail fiber/spike domain-containing protein [Proteus mirabilis]|uniref:tail fiber/spike domain-containing protein n=1 Tax=Proteus mirabilis TaxID=584 RepID=UPI0013773CE3|nr:SGNH/GDSL hydrolase family protein [Proteus mirabilis]NBC75410.1 hypothetical protein [Proteus mirabilis]
MSTIPTQNPVPSEAPRDLKFNSGKVDEFVTSNNHFYTDRFGKKHYTIDGINHLSKQAMLNYGYITKSSFESGNTIINPNDALLWEVNGEYYKWGGKLPKVVPPNSTPDSTGGIGGGKWLSVGDSSLRTDIEKNKYIDDATSIYFIPGVDLSNETTDNRDAIYEFDGNVFIPRGVSVRCNLLPDDDVTIFKGFGSIKTRDIFGKEHIFDVEKANDKYTLGVSALINKKARLNEVCTIGIIGDSITDGAYGAGWKENPTDENGNLSSTDYNHNLNGGAGSWFRTFTDNLNNLVRRNYFGFHAFNCASSGKRLIDGWANRNFDYGFFQNSQYGKTAPDICYLAMGVNDDSQIESVGFDNYLHRFVEFITKAKGYGCEVCVVSLNQNTSKWSLLENSIKAHIENIFPSVEFLDLSSETTRMYTGIGELTADEIAGRPTGVLDITHFGVQGHRYIGAYAAAKTFYKRVYAAKISDNLVPTIPLSANAWGYPSNKTYEIWLDKMGGNKFLSSIGGWEVISPDSENITIRYPIYINENDIHLVVYEPRSSVFTNSSRNHSMRIIQSDLRNNPYISINPFSRGKESFSEKLTTYVGKLRRGLNFIEIVYDGQPSKVFVPGLLFRAGIRTCIDLKSSFNVSGSDLRYVNGNILKSIPDTNYQYIMSDIEDEAPDSAYGLSGNQITTLSLKKFNIGLSVIFNYKTNCSSGCGIRRVDSNKIETFTIKNGEESLVESKEFSFGVDGIDITKSGSIIKISQGENTMEFNISGFYGGVTLVGSPTGGNVSVSMESYRSFFSR